jgi:hypothetical protein
MTALPAKPDIDGDRHAAPTKARGASAIASLRWAAMPNARIGKARGGRPEDLFWDARKRSLKTGPSGKFQKNGDGSHQTGVAGNMPHGNAGPSRNAETFEL